MVAGIGSWVFKNQLQLLVCYLLRFTYGTGTRHARSSGVNSGEILVGAILVMFSCGLCWGSGTV